MYLIYEPEDGPVERYDIDEMAIAESEAVERATGMKWPLILGGLREGSPTAMRAVLWTWRKRATPTLRFADFDVPSWQRRLKVRLTGEEVAEMVEAVEEQFTDDPDSYAQAMRELRVLAEDPEDIQRALDARVPKAQPDQPDAGDAPKNEASANS